MRPAEKLRAVPSATFGGTLRQMRERRGLSQAEVARRAGLVSSAVSNYEADKRGVRVARETVMALASALEADPAPLLAAAGWEPSGLPKGDAVRRAITADGLLEESDKQMLLALYGRLTRGKRGRQ